MKVKTKYDIGDRVWCISNNKVQNIEVTGFNITVTSEGTEIIYTLHYDLKYDESKVFDTKEELLKSL